ncbi:MAG: hypothetical protein AB7D17_07880 [Methanobacteriales archaeon]
MNQYIEKIDWSPYICECLASFTPWIVIAAYFCRGPRINRN